MKPNPAIAPFSIPSPRPRAVSGAHLYREPREDSPSSATATPHSVRERAADKGAVEKPLGHGYRGAMLTPGFSFFLAFLRIAAGISLFASGMQKLSWFAQPPLEQRFAEWAAHPANAAVAKYLGFLSQHPAVFSRVVPIGELGLGILLIGGLLTPLAALLAFLMVLNFQFASSQMFLIALLREERGLAS